MTGGAPLVSVVVPAHEAATTIGAAVSSVLWQTYPHVEVVVVDDGSTDGTGDVVAAVPDARVRLLRQDNTGPSAARNAGIAAARGELIALLDADDLFLPPHVEACVRVWQSTGGIVTANAYWLYAHGIDPRRKRHGGPIPSPDRQRLALLEQNWVSLMSLFERRLVDAIGPFDTTLERAEDWEFWLRAVYAGWRVHHQPLPLALFNRTGVTRTSATELVRESESEILEKMSTRSDLTSAERDYLVRRLAAPPLGALIEDADNRLAASQYRAAAGAYSRAASLCASERPLVRKARLLALAPPLVGPVLRRRSSRRAAASTVSSADRQRTSPSDGEASVREDT